MNPMRVLVVEDDQRVASFIQKGLEEEGLAVDVLHDGDDAGVQAQMVDYDCVVLDLMLPGRSGFQVLRDIRSRKAELPVLILSAQASPEERVAGLNGGADDYMGKPFILAELSARIRALLRRGKPRETKLRVADLEVDTVRRRVTRAGQPIDLKPKEYALLEFLVHNCRPSRHAIAHHRTRVGHPFRQHQQRRRSAHQFPQKQDRSRRRSSADSYRPRGRLHVDRQTLVKPLPLRTSLTIVYTGILAVLMTGLAITTHSLFVRQLDEAATTSLEEKARGLHGYLQFKGGAPVLEYNRDDLDSAAFIDDATDYYQVFDARDGRLLTQSPGLEALGLHYTPDEVAELRANAGPHDVQTDRGRLRLLTSVISPTPGEVYLVQVGELLTSVDATLAGFDRLLVVEDSGRSCAGGCRRPLVGRPCPGAVVQTGGCHSGHRHQESGRPVIGTRCQ